MLAQVLAHGPVREATLRSLYKANGLGVELRLEIETFQLLVGHCLSELGFVLVILRCVGIHLICSFLATIWPGSGTVEGFAFGIYAWREQRLCLLVYFVEALGLALGEQEALSMHTHAVELAIDENDLTVGEAERFAIH